MDRINFELPRTDGGSVEQILDSLTELGDLELALVGGGIGDTVL